MSRGKVATPGVPESTVEGAAPVEVKAKAHRVTAEITLPDDGEAAQVATLQRELAEMRGMMQQLLERGTIEKAPEAKTAKLIGDDLRPMSSAQVLAAIEVGHLARPVRAVFCADGYLTF